LVNNLNQPPFARFSRTQRQIALTSKSAPNQTEPSSLESEPWQWWRQQMPIAPRWAYFDHAAVAPLSQPARAAIERFADQAATLGDTVWPQWTAEADQLRMNTATLLGCDRREICLVPNTTTGINLVAEGYPWQSGDSVVIPDGEFPSNLFPWLNQQSKGVEVRIVPRVNGQVIVDDLIARVDKSTRIIAVSWVGYASGFRIDLDDLVHQAHEREVMVFLDAIQGLGMYPLDLAQTPVDFLAGDGHKWLLGPEGAGVAFIRSKHLDTLRCANVGWNSVKNAYNYASPTLELRSDAMRFESGSSNLVGAAALNASLELFLKILQTHGPDAIEKRVLELVRQLDESLRSVGAVTKLPSMPHNQSGILTFEVPGAEPNVIRKLAADHDVVVSCRGGGVRAAIHAYNDANDLDRLISVVRQCKR
jgi:selenocysteine lyase/cysteine desulfurase